MKKWFWLALVIIIGIVIGVVFFWSRNSPVTSKCSTVFTASPIALTDLAAIFPMGKMGSASGHVTPTDHQYWLPNGITETSNHLTAPTRYSIYAPGNGTIISLQHLPDSLNGVRVNDFRVEIDYGCGVSSAMMHVSRLTPNLLAEFQSHQQNNNNEYASVQIPMKAGDQIGTAGPHNVDFMVWDDNTTLPGFVDAKDYEREPWKTHIVDPLSHFSEPLKSQLTAKLLRTVEPRSGKIDYDVDGKLVGNWFKENYDFNSGRNGAGDLTIAYDPFQPANIILSFGDYQGRVKAFAVKGNAPDPATVGTNDTPTKYELVDYSWRGPTGAEWHDFWGPGYGTITFHADTRVQGVVLLQLLENRKLKMEVFPGKTASQVSGFTGNAQIYER